MPRLRRVSTQDPGWSRVHHGRGFRYLDVDGTPRHVAYDAVGKALVQVEFNRKRTEEA